ncbi:MAG: nitrophenyl compound nitroreductase subunit ArsF family protein [Lentisphaeria bacterium]|nr:nitrophenyl compound nitroreductase subunit ArsF family protein [Lentisphaeria bacterium]
MKTWITRILLAFVVFSLGFGVGREVGRRQGAISPEAAGRDEGTVVPGVDKVLVYYMHTTFRCVTCNTIERMTKEIVEKDFAEALAAGSIEWQEVNFQEREGMAKKYDIASSCVVVVRIEDGRETGFQRLDEVWTLTDKPAAFSEYVAKAIRQYLDVPVED